MNKKWMTVLILGAITLVGCNQIRQSYEVSVSDEIQNEAEEIQNIEEMLVGTWKADIENGISLRLIYDETTQKLVASSAEWGFCNYDLEGYSLENEKLTFSIPYKSGSEEYELENKDGKLIGSYKKVLGDMEIGVPVEVCFEKQSNEYGIGEFSTNEHTYSLKERKEQLQAFKDYESDGMKYNFSYEVGEETRDDAFIKMYELDNLTAGKQDVELMETLLNWVCKECNHGNPPDFPKEKDPAHVMAFGKAYGEMNCRALSLLLAGTLRMYGIEARHITCLPERSVFSDCHVVVEAYSNKLQQWVMLDPTYNLILKDSEGKYINVQTLRRAIINGEELTSNAEAGHNEGSFSVSDYITYMGKNCFRFYSAENLYPGAEVGKDGNRGIELVPVAYEETVEMDKYVITTDENKFFAPPSKE